MKRLSDLGKLRNQADKLMQQIGQRDNPVCMTCGKASQVMHHFIPKSVCAALRYDWDNLIPLCNGCHNRLHQSGDPEYEQKIIRTKGQEWYDSLQEKRKELIKVNKGYYEEKINHYKALIQ